MSACDWKRRIEPCKGSRLPIKGRETMSKPNTPAKDTRPVKLKAEPSSQMSKNSVSVRHHALTNRTLKDKSVIDSPGKAQEIRKPEIPSQCAYDAEASSSKPNSYNSPAVKTSHSNDRTKIPSDSGRQKAHDSKVSTSETKSSCSRRVKIQADCGEVLKIQPNSSGEQDYDLKTGISRAKIQSYSRRQEEAPDSEACTWKSRSFRIVHPAAKVKSQGVSKVAEQKSKIRTVTNQSASERKQLSDNLVGSPKGKTKEKSKPNHTQTVVESTLDEPPQHKPAAKEADGKPKSLIKKKSSQPTGATRELAEQTNRKAKADERYSPVHHVEYHGPNKICENCFLCEKDISCRDSVQDQILVYRDGSDRLPDFVKPAEVSILPCGHVFHSQCLMLFTGISVEKSLDPLCIICESLSCT